MLLINILKNLVLLIFRPRPTRCSTRPWYDSLPSEHFTNDAQISSFPKNFSTWARLNQFCSLLSTNTSISLRLNSWGLLLSFNKEDIFICTSFRVKKILYPVARYKKVYVYANNVSVSFFSSSRTHQSHHLDGCQAMDINSLLVCAFWALRFYTHRTTQKTYHHHHHHHHHHPNNHRSHPRFQQPFYTSLGS